MKPILRAVPVLVLLLLLLPVSLYAISVFDVIRMTQEKYPDQQIINVIRVTDSRFVLNAEDTARLKKEGVAEGVIREMLSRPARETAVPPAAQTAPKPARASSAAREFRKDVPADARTQPLQPASVLDEIVRLTKNGLSDDTVLAYAKAHRPELPAVLPADRLTWLRESGVSQTVILYLTAIDVRASNEGAPESATYDSDEGETYPVPADSSPGPVYDSGYDDGGTYAVYPGSYPVSDYASYYDYPYWGGFYYSYYPYYPYYPFYPFPAYFFADNFHHHGHDHGHDHGHGHGHGHDGGDGHHGSGHQGSPGDHPWGGGDRGSRGHGGNLTAGQTWRERPVAPSSNFAQGSRQPRGEFAIRGGSGRSLMPSRGLDRVYQGSRGFSGPRVVSRPGFSGGGHAGAMVGRAPISRSGGGPGAVGRPSFSGGGGRAGASVGRAPIARSGGGGMGRSGGGGMGHSGGGGRGR